MAGYNDDNLVTIRSEVGVAVSVKAGEVRRVARELLGMVTSEAKGPFTLDIFGQQMLANAMNREVHLANEHLRAIYASDGAGWREAVGQISAAVELCKSLGVETTTWVPGEDQMVQEILRLAGPPSPLPAQAPRPSAPVKGEQASLDLATAGVPAKGEQDELPW